MEDWSSRTIELCFSGLFDVLDDYYFMKETPRHRWKPPGLDFTQIFAIRDHAVEERFRSETRIVSSILVKADVDGLAHAEELSGTHSIQKETGPPNFTEIWPDSDDFGLHVLRTWCRGFVTAFR